MKNNSGDLRSIPSDFLFGENSFEGFRMEVEKYIHSATNSSLFEKVRNHFKKQFMHHRIAPQEILKPNEEVEVEDEPADQEMPMDSDDDSDDDQEKEVEPRKAAAPEEEDDGSFSQVKLVSKYAAFIKKNKKGFSFIFSSTQNVTCKGEVPLVKEPIADEYLEALNTVISKYPDYVSVDSLGTPDQREALTSLFLRLADL